MKTWLRCGALVLVWAMAAGGAVAAEALLDLAFFQAFEDPDPEYPLGSILLRNGQTGAVKTLVPEASTDILSWSPDGMDLVYTSAGNVFVYDMRTNQALQLTRSGDCHVPVVHPSGKALWYTRITPVPGTNGMQGYANLWRIGLDGSEPRKLASLSPRPDGFIDEVILNIIIGPVQWTPDDERGFVFVTEGQEREWVCVFSPTGRRLPTPSTAEIERSMGGANVVARHPEQRVDVAAMPVPEHHEWDRRYVLINRGTAEQQPLSDCCTDLHGAAFTTDGGYLAYSENSTIYGYSVGSSERRQLVDNGWWPAWRPRS